ncbi:MAG: hypothetical protein GY906_15935 [bacterium]|nr:hypothetical protein [bacterium]
MKSVSRYPLPVVVALVLVFPVAAQGAEWEPVTGAETLRELVSGLTVERQLKGGEVATGEYFADGTGVVHEWGASFPRTWEVKGETQICITQLKEVSCFEVERHTAEADLYRFHDLSTDLWHEVRAKKGVAGKTAAAEKPGSEGGAAKPTAAEIAAELANPNTPMGTLNTNFDFITFDGDLPGTGDQSALKVVFQPSLPYPLGGGTNFFLRPAIPIVFDQAVPAAGGGFESKGLELGDIGFDASFGFSFKSGKKLNVLIAGMAGTIPTATDDALGLDQWLLGPELGGFLVRKWGVVGIIASHQWNVAGEDSFDTSTTGGQYIYNFNLKDGWQITGSPAWSYNHNADSGDAWTLPLGGGIAKTAIWGGRPWKMSAQYWHFIKSPSAFGANHQIRVTIGPVVKLPWKGRQ